MHLNGNKATTSKNNHNRTSITRSNSNSERHENSERNRTATAIVVFTETEIVSEIVLARVTVIVMTIVVNKRHECSRLVKPFCCNGYETVADSSPASASKGAFG